MNFFSRFFRSLARCKQDREAHKKAARQKILERLMEAGPSEALPAEPDAGEAEPPALASALTKPQRSSQDEPSVWAHLVPPASPVAPGSTVSLTVATAPGAHCEIEVLYASGPSQAQGLEPRVADAVGQVTWTWSIGRRCSSQELVTRVVCRLQGQTASTEATLPVLHDLPLNHQAASDLPAFSQSLVRT